MSTYLPVCPCVCLSVCRPPCRTSIHLGMCVPRMSVLLVGLVCLPNMFALHVCLWRSVPGFCLSCCASDPSHATDGQDRLRQTVSQTDRHITCLTLALILGLPCSTHVASVVQMTHLLLQQAGVAKIMSEPQVSATYYSALTHDFEHLGVNNDYLIKSFHPLAVMYNDISPLENHHLAAAVRVMQRPECRFVKVRGGLAMCFVYPQQSVASISLRPPLDEARFLILLSRASMTWHGCHVCMRWTCRTSVQRQMASSGRPSFSRSWGLT